jgi:hypothetical protein
MLLLQAEANAIINHDQAHVLEHTLSNRTHMSIKNNENDQNYKAHALQTEFWLKGLLINQINNQNIHS